MFQYFLQQSVFRLFLIAVAVAFVGIFVYALILESTLKRPENMEVPFKAMTGKAVVAGVSQDSDITTQHMSTAEISDLLKQVIAESLSLDASNFTTSTTAARKYFTNEAYQQYLTFLNQVDIKKTLETQNVQSGAFAEQDPLELNHGVFGSSYKWLMEVPVTLSFAPRGSDGYESNPAQLTKRRFVLRAQFSRVKDAADPRAVKIEIWQASPARS